MARVVFTEGHSLEIPEMPGDALEELLSNGLGGISNAWVTIPGGERTVRINPLQVAYIAEK